MPREIVFVDLETTSLDPQTGEIIEVGMVLEDGASEISFKVQPEHLETADPQALKVNGYTAAEWQDAESQKYAAIILAEILNGRLVAGQNVKFDLGFIEALSKKTGVPIKTRYGLDTVSLAFEHLIPHGLRSLSMKDISRFLGFEPEPKVHRALNGARMAKMIWTKIVRANALQRWWWGVKYRFNEGRNDQ
jgi:DNA polymerase III epsilon subunit-like protein